MSFSQSGTRSEQAVVSFVDVSKQFTMHLRDGVSLPVMNKVSFDLYSGQCSVLQGPSGAGKSSLLKMLYGSYRVSAGQLLVQYRDQFLDIACSEPRTIIHLRKHLIGYVSQFLRSVPRVGALDVVAEPLVSSGLELKDARQKAKSLLLRLNLPEALWDLPPATFSGGEQQRINIARGFIKLFPILLLDEPTASLDAYNRKVVIELIAEKKQQGVSILGIFHDSEVREAVADNTIDICAFSPRELLAG